MRGSTLFVLVLQQRLHTFLVGAQVVGFATLLRSVAFDRWITVLAALLMVVGATAALRGRTWGVVLAFASAAAFPVAWAIGIAPMWFVYVGVIGALPFLLASGAMARVDRKATMILAALAASAGALGAILWKAVAWDLFAAVPALRPSMLPQHGLAVLALLVGGLGLMLATTSRTGRGGGPRVDASSEPDRARIAVGSVDHDASVEAEAEADAEHEARESRAASRR